MFTAPVKEKISNNKKVFSHISDDITSQRVCLKTNAVMETLVELFSFQQLTPGGVFRNHY